MTREEAITILECAMPNSSIHCGASDEEIEEAMMMAIEALDQEPVDIDKLVQKAYEDGKKDGYVQAKVEQESYEDSISRRVIKEQMIKYGFHAPDMTVTEFVEDLLPVNPQESKYCDHNICIKNEYNGISCDECEVTRSQKLKTEKVIEMRDATPEERESIDKYIKSISKPTGVDFWNLEQEPILNKIRSEVEQYNLRPSNYPCNMISIGTVLQIIDKYRGESGCHECKIEHDCYKCEKYKENEE